VGIIIELDCYIYRWRVNIRKIQQISFDLGQSDFASASIVVVIVSL